MRFRFLNSSTASIGLLLAPITPTVPLVDTLPPTYAAVTPASMHSTDHTRSFSFVAASTAETSLSRASREA